MNRRGLLSQVLCLFALAALALGGEVEVVFYHTSDLHEHSAPLARIAGFVEKQRETENVIFVDSGDWNNKGDLTELNLRGEPMAALMGAMGYDAIIPGNHDYSFGASRLAKLIDTYELPVVAANCTWPKATPKNVTPYKLFKFDGVTIAVIGTATAIMGQATGDALTVQPVIEAVKKAIAELEGKADIIAVLVHQGPEEDQAMIAALPRVDIVIAGHQHRRFPKLNYNQSTKTILQHSGTFGDTVGRITLRWDGKAITDRKVRLLKVTAKMPESPNVAAITAKYVAKKPQ